MEPTPDDISNEVRRQIAIERQNQMDQLHALKSDRKRLRNAVIADFGTLYRLLKRKLRL